MDFNLLEDQKVAIATRLGISLEFYCKFSIEKVAQKFSVIFKEPVEVVYNPENFQPERDKFYIVENIQYGKEMYTFTSLPVSYSDGRQILIKAFSLIKEFCYTDATCLSTIQYTYDKNLINLDLRKLDILKFILEFNEDLSWRFFPDQKDSVYLQSIKNILPQNKFFRSENFNASSFNYILPNTKSFAVDFNHIKDGEISMKYIGGKDYEYKIVEALDLIAVFNSFVSKCLFNPRLTEKNIKDLKEIVKGADKIMHAYDSYSNFIESYPDIKLTVDLDDNTQILKTKYVKFRDQIFDLLSASDITKGAINYDSSVSRVQLQGASGRIYDISGWEFVDCKLSIERAFNCSFFECDLDESYLLECNLYRYSTIKNSKLEDTYINRTCTATDTNIIGRISTVEGKIVRGSIYGGRIGVYANISKETQTKDYTKVYVK